MAAFLHKVAALTVLTLLAGAGLAFFADFTAEDVRRNRHDAETRVFRELAGIDLDTIAGGDVLLCDRGLVVLRVAGAGYGGDFRLAVALRPDASITGVRMLAHAETPGFADILDADSAWLGSFASGGVHAVTGATVTSEAVMAAVAKAVDRVRQERMCPP